MGRFTDKTIASNQELRRAIAAMRLIPIRGVTVISTGGIQCPSVQQEEAAHDTENEHQRSSQ